MSFQQVQLIGNLGRDPELRTTDSGVQVTDFSMAVNVRVKQPDGSYADEAVWWKVTAWRKIAEAVCQYLAKGDPVFVQGEPGVEAWTDQHGETRFNLKCNADKVQFLPKNTNSAKQESSAPVQSQTGQQNAADDDELIPF